jgi:HSP20 family protein
MLNNLRKGGIMKTLMKSNGSLFPAIPSLFDDLFNRDWLDSSLATWKTQGATLPATNVKESNDLFTIEVAAPGMKKDNFKIELQNNVLTISADIQHEHEVGGADDNYTRREFSYQSFQRSFSLPESSVEGNKISARYNDGILSITIPKREEAKVKPPKLISIS